MHHGQKDELFSFASICPVNQFLAELLSVQVPLDSSIGRSENKNTMQFLPLENEVRPGAVHTLQ